MPCILVGVSLIFFGGGGGGQQHFLYVCLFVGFLVAYMESVFSLTSIVLLLPLVRLHPFHGLYDFIDFISSDYSAKD